MTSTVATAATTTTTSARARLLHRGAALLLGLAAVAVSATVTAGPAAAADSIRPPAGYSCGNANVNVDPPRVWATNRLENVLWIAVVQRWDASRRVWYAYRTFTFIAQFNVFGQSPTSWSVYNTTTGGRYVNSQMHLPVQHRGYYRVASAVNGSQGGATWTGFVGGRSAYCFMP